MRVARKPAVLDESLRDWFRDSIVACEYGLSRWDKEEAPSDLLFMKRIVVTSCKF